MSDASISYKMNSKHGQMSNCSKNVEKQNKNQLFDIYDRILGCSEVV